ncbi:DUF72 domain-containing protein [Luteimonas kalidii]|uniref:DUF72 domain-containing protein n=1 Tax=Luteimonas kalidii TaxID=3042025 RepID=A0ABT6JUT0_9GAMM|nr:DUF72 domain-containing protein [Luteimonas kalidii]MDH5834440.1 DUF72 domain-containing protein [Luteimonas kalidii]
MSRIRVGCAGWSIPGRHRDLFDPGASQLARYATRFDAVEINSSFYRPHRRETYRRWAASVPRGFRFSVKLPRTVSHELRLRGTGPALDRFLAEVDGLGSRLGALLLQLPPSLAFDARQVSAFLRMFRRRSDAPLACEPRHASWFTPRVDDLLSTHAVTRVAADPARVPDAARPGGDTRWTYWRWHGAPRMYYSAYPDDALRALAEQVRAARGRGAAWVILDNTAHGHAVADAARLQSMLGGGTMPTARNRRDA